MSKEHTENQVGDVQITERAKTPPAKRTYQSPHIIVYGTVVACTRGSGGKYDDECTSGHVDHDEG